MASIVKAMRGYRVAGVLACAACMAAVLLAPTGASADHGGGGDDRDPGLQVYAAPSISGTAQVGQTLTAQGGAWSGPPGTQTADEWWRCPNPTTDHGCRQVSANATQYRLSGADQSQYLFVVLFAWSGHDADYAISRPSARVAAPPPPPPTPSFDVPAPQPVSNLGAVLQPTKPKAKLLRPFPVVRIRGRLTLTGARVSALTVKSPHRVKISVTCGGPGCPRSRFTRTAARTHLRPFERNLPSGLWLRVRITKRGYIGKQTVIRIRRGKAPLRQDGCVYPGHRKVQACPAG